MRKFTACALAAAMLLGLSSAAPVQARRRTAEEEAWRLVFEDNFDGAALDTNKWTVVNYPCQINNEPQFYSDDNLRLRDGNLEILTEKRSEGGRDYCSGAVTTQGRCSILYGKIEVRAKFSGDPGLWPAIWTCSDQIPGFIDADDTGFWPPEEDIFEGYAPRTHIYTCGHWYGKANTPAGEKKDNGFWIGRDWSRDYHVWSMEWTPEAVCFFLDGRRIKRSTRQVEKDEKQMLLINVAIHDAASIQEGRTSISRIDYVRIYAYAPDGR